MPPGHPAPNRTGQFFLFASSPGQHRTFRARPPFPNAAVRLSVFMQGRRPVANSLIKTLWNQHLHKNRAGNPLGFPSFRVMLATGKMRVCSTGCSPRADASSKIYPMSRNYLQAAVEIAQEAGKILIEAFSGPLD